MTDWQAGKLGLDLPMVLPIAATARWTDDASLHAAITHLTAASTRWMKLHFAGDQVEVRTALTSSFAPPGEFVLSGRAA